MNIYYWHSPEICSSIQSLTRGSYIL